MTAEQRKAKEQEIFNSMPRETFDEVMEVASEINEFRNKCKEYDKILKKANEEVEYCTRRLKENKTRYETFEKFMYSKIHQLIKAFCENNNAETLDEIRRELEDSGNPFEIVIHNKQDSFITENYFHIKSTETCYRFSNYDIEQDMARCQKYINKNKNMLKKVTERKTQIETEGEYTLWCIDYDDWGDLVWLYNGKPEWNFY